MSELKDIDPNCNYREINEELYAYVIARDGGLCQICGGEGQEVHHIIFKSQGGTNAPNNLVLLCWEHHKQCMHVGARKELKKKLQTRIKSNEERMRKRMV